MARLALHDEFTVGDYIYSVGSTSTWVVSPRVADKTKESYQELASTVIYDGETYYIRDLDGWEKMETGGGRTRHGTYSNCVNLIVPPTIPSTITSMHSSFEGCTSLTQVPEIPNGVTDMQQCFHGCTSLAQAPEIPSSVTNVHQCFRDCTSLTQAPVIPNGVINVTYYVSGCTSLVQAPEIPSGVTNVSYFFYGCTSLAQAPEIPSSVTNMMGCFRDCSSLTQAPVIPSGVTNMQQCFCGCTSLSQAPVIPSGVTDMHQCFRDCSSLAQAPVIPSSVTKITSCFYGCTSLSQAPVIPSGITDMSYCFRGCTSLVQAPVIPNSVTTLAFTFAYCAALTLPPIIPDGVTDLNATFAECTSLSKAPSIPSSVTNMRFTFNACPITETPLIPENVENMTATFQGCTLITTMSNIPPKVTELKQTFMGCTSLVNLIEIPSTVTSLHYTFRECAIENPPVIPNDVTNMRGTFQLCKSLLTAPVIPSKVTDMGYCFCSCEKITEPPTLPNGVEDISYCFMDCAELLSAPDIPSSVSNIQWCFCRCKKLALAPDLYNISTTDLTGVFGGCESMGWPMVAALPPAATILDRTFMNCTSLTYSPDVPSTVENMNSCFDGCTSLKRAPSIPASIKNLNECFEHCTSLEGNIVVDADLSSFIPFEYDGIFNDTAKDIFIIDMSGGEERVWSWIASSYNNVHYGFNDVTNPNCLISVYRVMADGDETPQKKGNYIFIRLVTKYYTNYTPEGTQVSCELPTLYMDGTSLSTEDWTIESAEGQKTYKMWVNPNDYDQHMFVTSQDVQYSVSVTSPRVFAYTKVKAVPSSQMILEKLYALINAYHDPTSGNEGIAFGTFALTTEPQFLVNLPERHLDEVTFESNRYIGLNDYEVEGSIHKQIFDAIVALGWTDVLSEDPTIGIELNYYSYDLYTYNSSTQSLPHYVQLIATPTPYTATVTWTSSDPLVASVDSTGYVTAINEDATQAETLVTITASITEHGSTVTAKCDIVVHSLVI